MTPYQAFWFRRRASGSELRAMREGLALTQPRLGKLFGIGWQSIHRFETGKISVPFAFEVLLRVMCAQEGGVKATVTRMIKRLQSNGRGEPNG